MKHLTTMAATVFLLACDGDPAQRGSALGESCARTADCTSPLICQALTCVHGDDTDAALSDTDVSDGGVGAHDAGRLSDGEIANDGALADMGLDPDAAVGPCTYPEVPEVTALNATARPISWSDAVTADGEITPFGFEAFHCDPEYRAFETLTIVICAPWSGTCQGRFFEVFDHEALAAAGGLVTYLQLTDASQENRSTSAEARATVNATGGATVPLAMGAIDIENLWPDLLNPLELRALPSLVVIRRHDMAILAGPMHRWWLVPVMDITADPDGDHSEALEAALPPPEEEEE